MTQDTRKDPRAKIVSLNVRYKSATVDEFIENHSHDVSKGGLFIKTQNPFAAGTLLKFEIRLAADQPVIAGVGRVVWKREAGQGSNERPAGMGVKFIKVDEASRVTIDKLVASKADAGSAYLSEVEGGDKVPAPPAVAAKAPAVVTPAATPTAKAAPITTKPLTPAEPKAAETPKAEPAAAAAAKTPFTVKKTMMGMGVQGGSLTPRPATSPLQRTAPQSPIAKADSKPDAGFFPQTDSKGDMPPPEERTVMKQAAELLEEALKEAGGSADEVGSLDKAGYDPPPQTASIAEPERKIEEAPKAHEPPPEPPKAAVSAVEAPPSEPALPPPPKPASFHPPPQKKKSNVGVIAGFLIVALAAGGFVAYKAGLFGSDVAPVATASASTPASVPSTPPSTPPSASVAPSASASVAVATPDAAPSVAPSATGVPVASVPVINTAQVPTTTTANTGTAVVPTVKPTASAPPTATTKPPPKPTASETDNPY